MLYALIALTFDHVAYCWPYHLPVTCAVCIQTKAAYVLFYMRREPQSAACRLPPPPPPSTVVSNGRTSDSEDSEADEMDCS